MIKSAAPKGVWTCDDPRRGESGGRPHDRLGGGRRSRTGLARSRTIRDFHGVPEGLPKQTHSPPLTPNGGPYAQRVKNHSLPRTAAFFDLDKTVIAKSSTLTFSKSFYQGGLINRRAVLRTAYAQFVFLVGGVDHDQMERMREYLSALCHGWNVQQVREIVAETLHALIDPIIYDEAASLIEEHHAAGRDVVIVSTSGAEVVEPIGALLGADRVVATRMVVEDGCFTGEVEYYAYGPTKAEAIAELAESEGYDLSRSYAYSDSVTDLPMLESVGHPHAVNPDRSLRREASARGLAHPQLQPPGSPEATRPLAVHAPTPGTGGSRCRGSRRRCGAGLVHGSTPYACTRPRRPASRADCPGLTPKVNIYGRGFHFLTEESRKESKARETRGHPRGSPSYQGPRTTHRRSAPTRRRPVDYGPAAPGRGQSSRPDGHDFEDAW